MSEVLQLRLLASNEASMLAKQALECLGNVATEEVLATVYGRSDVHLPIMFEANLVKEVKS